MAALAMGKISYGKWAKFFLPLLGLWWIVSFGILIFATITGYGPF